jgi:hypothetical protein
MIFTELGGMTSPILVRFFGWCPMLLTNDSLSPSEEFEPQRRKDAENAGEKSSCLALLSSLRLGVSAVQRFGFGTNCVGKLRMLLPAVLLGFVAWAPVPSRNEATDHNAITGDYVEARTASVFAGACHYNGELVTEGRDAVLAWNITRGSWNGVDLTGVRAMAEVACADNLGNAAAARRCELIVDPSATDAQAAAVADWLRSTDSAQLGVVIPPHRSLISFDHEGGDYVVNADGFAAMTVHAMPNNECCTQPHLVWYTPLMPLEHRKVGYTETAGYRGGSAGDAWERWDENSAFYGRFTVAKCAK